MRLALLTCELFPALWEDDRLAAEELRRRGHTVEPLVWRRATLGLLNEFDAIVVRNPWDWFHHRESFRTFLELLTRTTARVLNPPAMLLEFADKTYLPKLAARGVSVVPTVELTPEVLQATLREVLDARGWARAVIKPAFTANAVGAQVFDASECAAVLERAKAVTLAPGEKWLVQPFIASIAEGELSFIFFDGVFSHAVRKKPRAGDWRVQHDYGGVSTAFTPSAAQLAEATAILEGAAPGSTYGRVDAVEWNGKLHLMELEVVEPELFFRHDPLAPARFADAVLTPRGRAPLASTPARQA